MFGSRDVQVFVFLAILWRQGVLVRKTGFIFIYLLNRNSLSHQTWPIDRYKQGQYFSGIFWTILRTGAKFEAFFNLATCSNYSITNYIKIPVFDFFEKVNKGQLKMANVNY